MEFNNIEALLLEDEGLRRIGYMMAAEDIYDEVMEHLNLLDVEQYMLERIDFYYNEKKSSMGAMDSDAAQVVSELDSASYSNLVDFEELEKLPGEPATGSELTI